MLVHSSQTATRSGIGRWLAGTGNRFRRHGELRAAGSQHERRIEALLEAGYTTSNNSEVTCLLEETLYAALHDTGATVGSIMALDETETKLVIRAAVCTGEPFPLPDSCRLLDSVEIDSVEAQVFRTGEPQISTPELRERGRTAATRAGQRTGTNLQPGGAVLCVPLLERAPGAGNARTLGILTLRHVGTGMNFSTVDCRVARQAAGLVAGAIANAQAFAERKRTVIGTLQQMVVSLENKDPYTINHSHRVMEVCGLLAAQVDLDGQTVQELRTGAMLHDIGKIGVPAGVLNKPGNLTDEELALLKQYPIIGYELCQPLDLGDEILLLIRHHAEKLDGTGYPDQLRQGQLPLPLRILCVADAFDAMSSYRPYRKAMDARERNEQLNRFAGTQFDPTVVETLKGLLNSGHLDELYRDQWQLSAEMHQIHQQARAA